MPDSTAAVQAIAEALNWDTRVSMLRRIPEDFGLAQQPAIYSAVAKTVYVPNLTPDFAYVTWREEYSLPALEVAYAKANALTLGFTQTSADDIARTISAEPSALRIFRLLLGLLSQEFAAVTRLVAEELGLPGLTASRVRSLESGSHCPPDIARCCAEVVVRTMSRQLFPPSSAGLTAKVEKPDTAGGWATVQDFAIRGVPFPVFLHQRHYGGAFRQLLDSTSSVRGGLLEVAVEDLFTRNGVQFIRTGSGNQGEIERRFGVTVRPAPDFVVFDQGETLRAMLECKATNDGGTARDKAARYRALRQEATRLGRVPLFAVLSGLGWSRTADALGPVVRDTDGRTFTLANLAEMLTVSPFPSLVPRDSLPA